MLPTMKVAVVQVFVVHLNVIEMMIVPIFWMVMNYLARRVTRNEQIKVGR